MSSWITVRDNGNKYKVEIVRKWNVGLRPTHNKDGRYLLSWAIGVDGKLYRTAPRSNGYRPVRQGDLYPIELCVAQSIVRRQWLESHAS
jgi:hypothetical protein